MVRPRLHQLIAQPARRQRGTIPSMQLWFRRALFATGVVNVCGAFVFVPANHASRDLLGLPANTHPLYLWIIASWVFGFGVAYLWLAQRQRHEWLFIAIAAFGKLSFVIILAVAWLTGAIPAIGAAGGLWDLVLGVVFVAWLRQPELPFTASESAMWR
jgi:hypothetical protein